MYTVRDLVQANLAETLKQIAQIGYTGVELAGYGNLREPVAVKKAVHDAKLKIAGNHVGIEQLERNVDRVLDENEILGNRTIICPWMPEERRRDAAGWMECAQILDRVGRACRKRGFTFCYHHHSFEFAKFKTQGGEKTGMQILWENTDPEVVFAEIDVYWLAHGGADPVTYMRELGPRVKLVHLKDMAGGEDRKFAPVGAGTLNFPAILAACRELGVAWGIVEQDDCYTTPPMETLKISFRNLNGMTSRL